nr:hypothetical protein [uncultured bacterium]
MAGNEFWEFLGSKQAQLVLSVAGVIALCLVAAYIVGKIRGKFRESEPGASELMTNFRELHAQGGLSDEEYRTIKAKLAARIQQQVKDSERKG